jgi:3-hydroxyacyl-[acyl-carrier-protein] dehydratase
MAFCSDILGAPCSGMYNSRRMKFHFVDQVVEQQEDRIVTTKQICGDEDYLKDHFPTFPIMPGVLMLESMVQAASLMVSNAGSRQVLGEVRALKYGTMVKPGDQLKIEIQKIKSNDDGSTTCKGVGTVSKKNSTGETQTAVAGRFTIRPVRMS